MPKGYPKNGINRGWFSKELRPLKKTGIYKVCNCGTEFYCEKNRINRKKYCSIKCRCDFHPKGAKYSDEARKKISKSRKGIVFSFVHRMKIGMAHKGTKLSQIHIEKIRNATKGEKNWQWIKDRNLLKKSEKKHLDSRYKEWMLSVKNRDDWKCRIADDKCNGRLEAHHILNWKNYPELRYEINNGITLCHFHHPKKRVDEEKLSPYFQKLVAEM